MKARSGWTTGDDPANGSSHIDGGLPASLPVEVLLIARRRAGTPAGSEGFDVSEEFVFADSSHAVINTDRGFTLGEPVEVGPSGGAEAVPASPLPDEEIRRTVRNVVGAEAGASAGGNLWERLARVSTSRGLAVTAERLRKLPLRIEIIR